ncbi:DUF551 domain-containing protein [Klebsiella pneumoniae]|nr:DUF551 domain-containing protein [Klebsiella pneumoniae]
MTLPPSHDEIEELARMALAALSGEPVAWTWHYREQWHVTNDERRAEFVAKDGDVAVLPLYRHAQPTPVLEREPIAWLNDAYLSRGVVDGEAGSEDAGPGYIPVYREAVLQPEQVVPEEATPDSIEILASARRRDHAVFQWDEDQRNAAADSWNAFRAAMLQELKKSAGAEAICRSDENVQVLHTKSPAQSDCCPAQNHVSPEQNGDTPAQSQGWIQVSEQMPPSRHEVLVGRWWGEKPRWCCKWATYIPGHPDAQSSGWLIPGASWTPTHWMPLPAAPQEVNHG